jgi:calcineurin-like phosphoesterase family protein
MPRVRTAVVSDLHLGGLAGMDVAREGEEREALVEALSAADRVVLLGDVIELRERPLADSLEVARPLFEELGSALAGRPVVLVPGNHDHALAEPWLARLRLDARGLPTETEWPVQPEEGAAGRIAAWMPDVELTLAYPGLHLRDDVYATHGHYLDLHLTIPRLESIAASAMARVTRRGKSSQSAEDYEAILSPLYAFYAGLAQGATPSSLSRGGSLSRDVWRIASGNGRRPELDSTRRVPAAARRAAMDSLTRFLLGRVTIPGAVAALNGLGLGPFRATLTGEELRSAGLLAMARVAEVLAPGAEHVIFGHTHRPGPLPGDERAEWTTLSGSRLWNTGSWLYEGTFITTTGRESPYWPGTVLTLEDEGPPRLENVLAG